MTKSKKMDEAVEDLKFLVQCAIESEKVIVDDNASYPERNWAQIYQDSDGGLTARFYVSPSNGFSHNFMDAKGHKTHLEMSYYNADKSDSTEGLALFDLTNFVSEMRGVNPEDLKQRFNKEPEKATFLTMSKEIDYRITETEEIDAIESAVDACADEEENIENLVSVIKSSKWRGAEDYAYERLADVASDEVFQQFIEAMGSEADEPIDFSNELDVSKPDDPTDPEKLALVRQDYEAKKLTIKQVADKHKIDPSTVSRLAKAGNWKKRRKS